MSDPVKRDIVTSIEAEYRRYKALGEAAFGQLDEADLGSGSAGDNSVATIVWHIAGNLESRFTGFLTTDGEKPWRQRESEFTPREGVSCAEVTRKWERGWEALFAALGTLDDANLADSVAIRGVPLTVAEALHRSLAHTSYHVGQIVYLSKRLRGSAWKSLSIPPGGSAAYNRDPSFEKPTDHVGVVGARTE